MTKTRVVFTTTRHYDVHTSQRVDGHQRTIDHDLLRSGIEKVGSKLAEEGGRNRFLLVKPDENIRSLVLSSRVYDARHGIYRPATMGLHAHPHRSCHLSSIV